MIHDFYFMAARPNHLVSLDLSADRGVEQALQAAAFRP